jgi:DNA-binding SARP family transcriptional activator
MMGRSNFRPNVVPLPTNSAVRRPTTGADPQKPLVRIHVLGSIRATTHLGQNVLPPGRKARAILGYLSLCAGEHVARARLGSLLWDRVDEKQARTNFRQSLRRLSAALGPLSDDLIETTLDNVRLDPKLCWIDAVALLSTEALPPQTSRTDLASVCTGELLEDLTGITPSFDQWLLTERTRFTEHLRQLFEAELQGLAQSDASPERCAALARRVIAFDPTHEGASRILMRALADLGERAQALREFDRCRGVLKATLDVEPSPETRALYRAVRTFAHGRDEAKVHTAGGGSEAIAAKPVVGHTRLRVGVLPFRSRQPLPNDGLAFSVSQEIAAALARFRWFDVIAPESLSRSDNSFRFKHLHYVVDGDLTGNADKLQFVVRLLDVTQEIRPVWSDQFELTMDALDRLNEFVVAPLVARIDPVILFIEGQQPQRSGATGLVLRAVSLMYDLERESYEEAGRLLTRALRTDPKNAKAAAWGAYWHVYHVGQGWAANPSVSAGKAQALALQAIRCDPENAEAYGIYAHVCAFLTKDFDSALHYFDRALRLNPNIGFIWALSALTHCYIGEPDVALQQLDHYRELAPFDPLFRIWENVYTVAYVFKGDYENAAIVGRRVAQANPDFTNGYKPLIAALGHLGRTTDATPYVERLLAREPRFTVEKFGKHYPFKRPEDRERYLEGLRLAGVPEI